MTEDDKASDKPIEPEPTPRTGMKTRLLLTDEEVAEYTREHTAVSVMRFRPPPRLSMRRSRRA